MLNKKQISDVDKFTYLLQSLKGEPLLQLTALENAHGNYELSSLVLRTDTTIRKRKFNCYGRI